MSFSDSSDEESNWKNDLQANRQLITERVVYTKLHVQLLSKFVFDEDDDQEILNQFTNPTLKSQTNEMVNKILKRGEENYKKFLKILGETYPDVYKRITGKEAPVPQQSPGLMPDIVPPYSNQSSSTQDVMSILIERLDLKKKECEDLARQNLLTKRDLDDRQRDMSNLKEKIREFERRIERYGSMERDMAALKDVLDQVKNENYKVCMRLVDINEENSRLREHNMAIRVENDKLKVDVRKMESTVNSERSVSVRLRKRIETGPSVQVIHSLQQEIDNLKLKLAQSSRKLSIVDENVDTRFQILQHDKEEAIQMYVVATEQLNKLREEFHSAETLRDKYLEENERLQLQVSALNEDCEMYKNRRDSVWQQLQEVEKERDQLMKERNEAQMTAQNHMDEKTKYRAEIRKLEEKHDDLSQKLRKTANELRHAQRDAAPRSPNNPCRPMLPDGFSDSGSQNSTVTDTSSVNNESAEQTKLKWECRKFRCNETKYYKEFCGKSEFNSILARNMLTADGMFPEIPLASNYGKKDPPSGNPRRGVIRKKMNRSDSRQAQAGSTCRTAHENRSRTSSSESSYQRKLDKENSNIVEIDVEFLKKHVKLIGGNENGIFVNQVMENTLTCALGNKSLQPGMKLIEISSSCQKAVRFEKCTFEYISNAISDMNGMVAVVTDNKPQEYSNLKDKIKNSRMTGDSFYVRANFKWNAEDMLNFNKNEILHVTSTQQYAEKHWVACKIDPYNGNNASKCEIIPSVKYCKEHPMKQDGTLPKGRRLTESDLFTSSKQDQYGATHSSVKTPSPKHVCGSHLVIGRQAEPSFDNMGQPYTIVKAATHAKDKPRPCLLLPQSLSKILSYKLTTIAEPLIFDFPFPESVNCSENSVRVRLTDDPTMVSFESVTCDMQQIVTSGAVEKTSNMGKHSILSINENCIGIREYLKKLQSEDLYPILIFLQTDKPKTVRMFVEEKGMTNTVFQDVILTAEQLKRFGCRFVTVNLDRCNRVEDAIQVIMERIADESNRIVWQDAKDEVVF